MMSEEFEKTIKLISRVLENNKIKWALVGSANMAIQGMNVDPRDLDIVVQLKNLKKMTKIFLNYRPSKINELKPFTKELAWEVKLIINNIEVQIFGERDTGEYVRKLLANKLIKIKLGEAEIPCFTLKAEAQTYAETNRGHKAKLTNKFLKSKTFI